MKLFKISWERHALLSMLQNPHEIQQVWVKPQWGDHNVYLDRLIEGVEFSQRIARREFLKGWKQYKLCKMLPEHRKTRKKRPQKKCWQWQGLQNEYTVAYQSIGQALHLLPIQILRVLQGSQNQKTSNVRRNDLVLQIKSLAQNKTQAQTKRSPLGSLFQPQEQLTIKQWLSLLQRDGGGFWTRVSGHEGLGSLASWLKPYLFLSVYPSLKIYSNKTYLGETYFRKPQVTCFHRFISEKFITLKEALQSTSHRGEPYERS